VDPTRIVGRDAVRRCFRLLAATERARCARFRIAGARHEYLVAHALLRFTLSRYAGVDPSHWMFSTTARGRPEIAVPRGLRLRFNLSHTSRQVACAVTRERSIGIDVEDIARPLDHAAIAHRFFSSGEVHALRAIPSATRVQRFFELWTLKEAYLKARGIGLSLPLDRFSFETSGPRPVMTILDPALHDEAGRWQFAILQPTPRHVLAVAVERTDGEPVDVRVTAHADGAIILR
jgi:4'-phosphopantetheinyl transferase